MFYIVLLPLLCKYIFSRMLDYVHLFLRYVRRQSFFILNRCMNQKWLLIYFFSKENSKLFYSFVLQRKLYFLIFFVLWIIIFLTIYIFTPNQYLIASTMIWVFTIILYALFPISLLNLSLCKELIFNFEVLYCVGNVAVYIFTDHIMQFNAQRFSELHIFSNSITMIFKLAMYFSFFLFWCITKWNFYTQF